jgi:hypothetical protein
MVRHDFQLVWRLREIFEGKPVEGDGGLAKGGLPDFAHGPIGEKELKLIEKKKYLVE